MADSAKVCPHCGGNIETELNCSICRLLFGLGKTFRTEDWLRRTPPPATKAMIADVEKTLREIEERDPEFNRRDNCNPWIATLIAFLAEWKPQVPE